jgi:hypothetical protein
MPHHRNENHSLIMILRTLSGKKDWSRFRDTATG